MNSNATFLPKLGLGSGIVAALCGECGISRDVTVTDTVAQRYDAELQRSAAPIVRAADRLEHERLASEA